MSDSAESPPTTAAPDLSQARSPSSAGHPPASSDAGSIVQDDLLPTADSLCFHGTAVFETGFLLDFSTEAHQREYTPLLQAELKARGALEWHSEGGSLKVGGEVDNFSAPRLRSFLWTQLPNPTTVTLLAQSGTPAIELELSRVRAYLYPLNTGVLHFRCDLPREHWEDLSVLRRIRRWLQVPRVEGEKGLEEIFGAALEDVRAQIGAAITKVQPPQLETPFLDFKVLTREAFSLHWSHATLVAVLPAGFEPNGMHFKQVLLDVEQKICNASVRPGEFAYVESGDSLVCVPNQPDLQGRDPEQIAFDHWVQWIGLSHYLWKTAWTLDRGLFSVLNQLAGRLRRKEVVPHADRYAVNGLLNGLRLILDAHEPRNVTSSIPAMQFLKHIRHNWRADEFLEAAERKKSSLQAIVGQLQEIRQSRSRRRLEVFLTAISLLSVASLVLAFIQATQGRKLLSDASKIELALGAPALLMAALGAFLYVSRD
jgi:hypothetical protein